MRIACKWANAHCFAMCVCAFVCVCVCVCVSVTQAKFLRINKWLPIDLSRVETVAIRIMTTTKKPQPNQQFDWPIFHFSLLAICHGKWHKFFLLGFARQLRSESR